MTFLLVDIGYDCEELNEPLGIDVLASFLKVYHPSVTIHTHCSNLRGYDWDAILESSKPDILGVSTHINTWKRLDSLYVSYLNFCKRRQSSPIIVIGGILASYEYGIILQKYENVICAIGEGEGSLSKIIQTAQEINNLSCMELVEKLVVNRCNNIAVRYNGEIYTASRSVQPDLTRLDYCVSHEYLKDTISNQGIARIEASRGCPWNRCSFCVLDWKYAGVCWRPYSWEKVIPEIIKVSNLGASTIYFTDEEFLAGGYDRYQSFIAQIRMLKQAGIIPSGLEFVASTSAQALLGKYEMTKSEVQECLMHLKQIGFRAFFLGIESGCDSQLIRYMKGSTVQNNEDAIALLRKYGIEADIGYILFDPLMKVSELEESLAFLKRNHLDHHMSRFAKRLRLVPHTAYLKKEGIVFECYNHDSVELLYKFSDPDIRMIFDCFSKWESTHLGETHMIQAEIRACDSTFQRKQKMNTLEKIRHTEYDVLCRLVELSRSLHNFSERSIDEIMDRVFDHELLC